MDNSALLISGLQIAASLGSIALFLIGLYTALQDFQYINPQDPADEDAHSKAAARKSLLMIILGIAVHSVGVFFRNLPDMVSQNYGIAVIILNSLWQSLRSSALLLLCPIAIRLWRKLARRNNVFN